MAENSDQNQSDSNNDQEGRESTESNSHLTLANLTRFGAVALFVVLGTFAVIHSMRSDPNESDKLANHDHDHADTTQKGEEEGEAKPGDKQADASQADPDKTTVAKDSGDQKFDLAKVTKIPALGLSAASSMVTLPSKKTNTAQNQLKQAHPNSIVHSLEPQSKTSNQFGGKPKTSTQRDPKQDAQLAQKKVDSTAKSKSAFNGFPTPKVETPAPKQKTAAKTTSAMPPPKFNPNAFGAPPQKDLAKKLPAQPKPAATTQKLTATPPPRAKTGSPFDTPPEKPATNRSKPPERLAQIPGGRPLTGSNGFGVGAPKVDSTAGSFIDNAKQGFENLKANTQKAKEKVANGISDAQKNLKQGLSNLPPIGNRRQTTPPPQQPSNIRQFTPPSVGGMNDLTSRPPPSRTIESAPMTAKSSAQPPATNTAPATNAAPPTSNLMSNNPFARKAVSPPPRQDQAVVRSKADIPPNRPNAFGTPPAQSNNGFPASTTKVPAQNVSTSRTLGNRSLSSPPPTATPMSLPSNSSAAATLNVPGDRDLDGIQAPALTLQKIPPREVQVNQVAEFQVVIKNVGRTSVNDVKVFDRVPDGTNFEGATPNPNTSTNGQLGWNLGTIEPGTEKRIVIRLKPTRPGMIGSVAQFSFSTPTSMRTRVTEPKLEISHIAKSKVLVGDDVIFDVSVTNKGDGPARNVLIQEDIPKQLSFRDNYEEIEYEVGTLQPGQTKKVRLALKAKQAGRLTNTMYATAAGGLKSEHAVNMEVVAPTLKVKSEGPIRRFLGRNMKHKLSLANQGTAPATNVELIAKLPSGLRFVRSNNQGTYDPATHSVYWSLAQLASKADAGVELETTPVNVGNHPIKVETFADLNLRDQTVQALSIEHRVDVFFDIDDVVDPIEIGSETQHRVQVVNQGTKTVTNVRLQIDYPNGLKPTKVNGPLTHNIQNQVVQFTPIANLKPGEKLSFTVNSVGQLSGDHRVSLKLSSDDRKQPISKEESTHVYSDR